MGAARYLVGIDLGTSNTVLAYAALAAPTESQAGAIRLFEVEQQVGPGEVAALPLLPSARYHPAPGELAERELDLPWSRERIEGEPAAVVGRRALDLGAQVPGRLVASAKSWLSHTGVDRGAAILPWGAPEDVAKVSPVVASASYLAHLRAAWNASFPADPLESQQIVLTVPASFDEGARALTLEAARLAGLPALRLLEEPQAAFHDWLWRHGSTLAAELAGSRLVLVVDVGGGTTDLTLVQVEPGATGEGGAAAVPRLTRVGVGDHLMLGGDNMDLALAHLLERRLSPAAALPAARFSQLVQRCRAAKERLLGDAAPERVGVTLLGGGARLVGGALTAELARDEVERLVIDGFLPLEAPTERPRRKRAGLVEFGLPYPADAAITRHLAAFLERHASVARQALGSSDADGLPVPDTLLLNGGVFRSPALVQRIERVLSSWRGRPLRVLHNDAPELAVARGAVAHALLRAGRLPALGSGIGGGSARSYFLVLEQGGHAQGICVLPRGTPEGTEVELPQQRFALRLGQPVRFHLASTVSDRAWTAGELVDLEGEEFVRLPALAALLPAPKGRSQAEVSVRLVATMTEVGTLEMHCVASEDPGQRWRLSFQLRGDQALEQAGDVAGREVHARLAEAVALIGRVFGDKSQQVDAREVRQLRAGLERLLGAREQWDLPLLRALFDALMQGSKRRRRSAEHERAWLNLAGFCLRPGTGAPLDDWRVARLWELYPQGIQFQAESNNWSEWWTLWRRAAAGLDDAQQLELLQTVGAHLEQIVSSRHAGQPLRGSYDDMLRLVAALERVPAAYRAELGQWLVGRLQKAGDRTLEKPASWWAVGRLGARVSLCGSAQNVVPPGTAADWLAALLALDWKAVEPAAFAAAQIARVSGDRARDLPAELREQVASRLAAARAPESWVRMVREAVELDEADQRRSYGEALPPGLRLLAS
ncbi:MAG: hypothetical protein RJA36_1209 [Pseudomonadota bacterium]